MTAFVFVHIDATATRGAEQTGRKEQRGQGEQSLYLHAPKNEKWEFLLYANFAEKLLINRPFAGCFC